MVEPVVAVESDVASRQAGDEKLYHGRLELAEKQRMNTIAEVERCKNCPPCSNNRFDTLEDDFDTINVCWRVNVRSVELTALAGRYAIHVIKPVPSAVPGLRLQKADA